MSSAAGWLPRIGGEHCRIAFVLCSSSSSSTYYYYCYYFLLLYISLLIYWSHCIPHSKYIFSFLFFKMSCIHSPFCLHPTPTPPNQDRYLPPYSLNAIRAILYWKLFFFGRSPTNNNNKNIH